MQKEQRKKQEGAFLPFFFLHFSFLIFLVLCLCSCDTHGSSQTSTYKSFEYKLRGKWVSNEPNGLYSGTLKIDSDTIIIDGYEEDYWTASLGDDSKRPFKDFPKRVSLKGYSENGKIFIEYPTSVQNEIPYVYTETGNYPDKVKILEFTFGGKAERLQCPEDS